MSEKNLAIRNKFLSKINRKMTDLNESLELLQKVDRRLIQQSGGSLQQLQLSVLQLAQKRNEVEQLSRTIQTLQQNMSQINQRLAGLAANITQLSQQFQLPQVNPDDFKIDGISEQDFTTALGAKDAAALPLSLQSYSQQLFPSQSSSSAASGQPTLPRAPSSSAVAAQPSSSSSGPALSAQPQLPRAPSSSSSGQASKK